MNHVLAIRTGMTVYPLILSLQESLLSQSRLLVDLGNTHQYRDTYYPIVIGFDLITQTGQYLERVLGRRHCIVITDDQVSDLYLAPLIQSLDTADHKLSPPIIIASGEQAKNFQILKQIVDDLLERHSDRQTTIIALGGGVIGDLAGFCAAITLRGLDLVHIPTTLMAQIDSSIGGKTGINTQHGKNLVGAFYPPRLVLTDMATLRTLSLRHRQAGYVEILKYALINDGAFFDWLERHGQEVIDGDPIALTYAVLTSCRAKAQIVKEDEREKGNRALLNLGHTFGHAFEAVTGYCDTLIHGEAVAIGLVFACRLSQSLGFMAQEEVTRIYNHMQAMGLPVEITLLDKQKHSVLASMSHDKKVIDGRLTVILLRGIGQAFIAYDVDTQVIVRLLDSKSNT